MSKENLSALVEQISIIDKGSESNLAKVVKAAFDNALICKGKLDQAVLDIDGMSGKKYRYFVNNLVELIEDARYLEIGSWMGSTLCAALNQNTITATAVDNWSLFGGPIAGFFKHISEHCSAKTKINVLTKDFRELDYETIGKYNLYLFDGPHRKRDQYDGVAIVQPALDDECIIIVDDWNLAPVREGTFEAIGDCKLNVLLSIEVKTRLNDENAKPAGKHSDWHNGYFVAVVRKPIS